MHVHLDEGIDEDAARAWAFEHGLTMRRNVNGSWSSMPAPISLRPASWPRFAFEKAVAIQPYFNRLVLEIVNEHVWLEGICNAIRDDFVERLCKIWKECPTQKLRLGLFRSDYMLHGKLEQAELKQVELNTIAASFSHLSQLTCDLHRENSFDIPANTAGGDIAVAIRDGLELFKNEYGITEAMAIMVVQPEEGNLHDQEGIIKQSGISMVRLTLEEVGQHCTTQDGVMMLNGVVVGLVYYRSGYSPSDYVHSHCWTARLMVERSSAVKIPDIAMHLAGLKKVQQELACPTVLSKFMRTDGDLLASTFMELLHLEDNESGRHNAERVLSEPDRWIAKPQREGGGHNIFGSELVKLLSDADPVRRTAHIIMEKIDAPSEPSILLRDKIWREPGVSELDI
ncbi:Glutathione synthetase [Paramicrosporidium saccamoebae]|uniref:Glutathione synthetase n=1 Tax=Paramicrosporidium saccamoebae TaxID=1246581 RepID=A0A2H9TG74_9FUNG|nr:Glutathione synthetase [Paramicrosporidium saccamoebae]